MRRRKHEHKHSHQIHSSEEGFISDNLKNSMNRNEKIIMGVLVGGIIAFLGLSILVLFGKNKPATTSLPTSEVPSVPPEKVVKTPYPTIPPIENMTIILSERRFSPQSFEIPRGGMVVFFNMYTSPITIEANDANSGMLNLGEIKPSETKEVTFVTPGTYTYRNKNKPSMIGIINIK